MKRFALLAGAARYTTEYFHPRYTHTYQRSFLVPTPRTMPTPHEVLTVLLGKLFETEREDTKEVRRYMEFFFLTEQADPKVQFEQRQWLCEQFQSWCYERNEKRDRIRFYCRARIEATEMWVILIPCELDLTCSGLCPIKNTRTSVKASKTGKLSRYIRRRIVR